MQTTRFTSIGSRVEIATLMAVSTVTSRNPSARPGMHLLHLCPLLRRLGDAAGRLAEVVGELVPDPRGEQGTEQRRKSASTPSSIPRNLPMMNWRRLIGFESSVIAVLPSISSATVELAVSRASNRQANEIVVSPVSLYILMSSPNVKYDTKIVQMSNSTGEKRHHENAGWRIASLAVANAMVIDFMVVVKYSGIRTKYGKTDRRQTTYVAPHE